MKIGNVKENLKTYRVTLNKLYHPLILLTQLYIAYFRCYISRYFHTKNGVPRAIMLTIRQFSI